MESLTGTWAAVLQIATFVVATGVLVYLFKLGGFFALAQKHFEEEEGIHKEITKDVKDIGKAMHSIDKRIAVHDSQIRSMVDRYREANGREPDE